MSKFSATLLYEESERDGVCGGVIPVSVCMCASDCLCVSRPEVDLRSFL